MPDNRNRVQTTPADSLSAARKAAILGIAGSGTLGVLKIAAGWIGNSHAVIADGVESACDTISSGLVLVGLEVSKKPPDAEHPYGHARAEDIAGKTISTMMVISGAYLLWSNVLGLTELIKKTSSFEAPANFTIWIMLVALAVKGWLFLHKLRVAEQVGSVALRNDAWNDFTDVLSASAVLIGLTLTHFGFNWADRAGAVVVASLIVYTGARISLRTSAALMDQQAPPEVIENIRSVARQVSGVEGIEKVLARRAGLMFFVDLHVEVSGEMNVHDAHEIGHAVKARIMERIPEVADVLIHIEPAKRL